VADPHVERVRLMLWHARRVRAAAEIALGYSTIARGPRKNYSVGIDFGKTAHDYGRHRAGFPEAFFDRLFSLRWVTFGAKVLDLGTGTGTIARGLAERGCEVTGLDPAPLMLAEAARLDDEAGVKVTYLERRAEDPGLPPQTYDVVIAGQCWHWFERSRAAAQAYDLLKPGGSLTIAHFDWIPLDGNVVALTERLIAKHNPRWTLGGGNGTHPQWLADLALAQFAQIETFSFDVTAPYTHEGWRGRIRASAGVGASLSPDEVEAFDADHAATLMREFPDEPLAVPHRVWAVRGRKPVIPSSPP
jgi:SAM-dependent methyltransferase